MSLGSKLKYAGYDHLIIMGRAAQPVYLRIFDERVEIHPAGYLWGRDIYEVTDELWKLYGRTASVLCTGPAGENRVVFSLALVDKASTLGKGGLGAVMGSKNLKAVVVDGTGGIEAYDRKKVKKLVDRLSHDIALDPHTYELMKLGKITRWKERAGSFTHKNHSEVYPLDKAWELFGEKVYLEKAKEGRLACISCPLGEKEVLGIKEKHYQGAITFMSNWPGRVKGWALQCGLESYDEFLKIFELASRQGLSDQPGGYLLDLLFDLYEKGIIGKEDVDGLALERGFRCTKLLLEKIVRRDGIGDALADGYPGLAAKFGERVKDYLFDVKGLEYKVEPRIQGLSAPAFSQILDPRAHHVSGGSTALNLFSLEELREYATGIGIQEEEFERIFCAASKPNIGRLTRHCQDWYALVSSLGLCTEPQVKKFYNIEMVSDLFEATTGIPMDWMQLKKVGERSWNLLRAMNVKEGFDRKDDKFPKSWLMPLKWGGKEIFLKSPHGDRPATREDLENLLDDYYDERGWDIKSGIPPEQKLGALGLKDLMPGPFPGQ